MAGKGGDMGGRRPRKLTEAVKKSYILEKQDVGIIAQYAAQFRCSESDVVRRMVRAYRLAEVG